MWHGVLILLLIYISLPCSHLSFQARCLLRCPQQCQAQRCVIPTIFRQLFLIRDTMCKLIRLLLLCASSLLDSTCTYLQPSSIPSGVPTTSLQPTISPSFSTSPSSIPSLHPSPQPSVSFSPSSVPSLPPTPQPSVSLAPSKSVSVFEHAHLQ